MNHIIFKLSSSAPQVPHKIFILKLGPLFRKERSEIKPGNLRIRILCEPKSINGFGIRFGIQAGILDSDKKKYVDLFYLGFFSVFFSTTITRSVGLSQPFILLIIFRLSSHLKIDNFAAAEPHYSLVQEHFNPWWACMS